MKQIKQIANASNFKAVDFGELSELKVCIGIGNGNENPRQEFGCEEEQ